MSGLFTRQPGFERRNLERAKRLLELVYDAFDYEMKDPTKFKIDILCLNTEYTTEEISAAMRLADVARQDDISEWINKQNRIKSTKGRG